VIKWYYALLIEVAAVEPTPQAGASGGVRFISTNADAEMLWRKRKQEIEELALARTQPRVISRSR